MIRVAVVVALLALVLVEGQLTGSVDGVPGDKTRNGTMPRPPKRHCPRGPMEKLACKVVDDATGDVLKEHPCRNGTECSLGPLEIDTPENDSISIYFCDDEFNQQLAQRLACRIQVGEEVVKNESCIEDKPCTVGPLGITYEGADADAYFCELPPKRGHRERGHGRGGRRRGRGGKDRSESDSSSTDQDDEAMSQNSPSFAEISSAQSGRSQSEEESSSNEQEQERERENESGRQNRPVQFVPPQVPSGRRTQVRRGRS